MVYGIYCTHPWVSCSKYAVRHRRHVVTTTNSNAKLLISDKSKSLRAAQQVHFLCGDHDDKKNGETTAEPRAARTSLTSVLCARPSVWENV